MEDTNIDDEGVGASSVREIELLQKEIWNILGKGVFSIKSWECSGEDGASKYLGMTWDCKKDYLLKFCLNLSKKFYGTPSGADLDEEFLQDRSIHITKRNALSVACQFYDPTVAHLMFPVPSLYSNICWDRKCSMNSVLSDD